MGTKAITFAKSETVGNTEQVNIDQYIHKTRNDMKENVS